MSPITLADMLRAEGLDGIEERLRWMILTWDLAKIGGAANQYVRFFATTGTSLAYTARRTPKHFSREDPLSGAAAASRFDDNDRSLEIAINQTTTRLDQGYGLVCRPLAIDCFDFTHTTVIDGAPLRDAGQLVEQMAQNSDTGTEVLAYLNWARGEARRTHLAPDWQETTGYTDPVALWSGR